MLFAHLKEVSGNDDELISCTSSILWALENTTSKTKPPIGHNSAIREEEVSICNLDVWRCSDGLDILAKLYSALDLLRRYKLPNTKEWIIIRK